MPRQQIFVNVTFLPPHPFPMFLHRDKVKFKLLGLHLQSHIVTLVLSAIVADHHLPSLFSANPSLQENHNELNVD